jgi:hypothetical protein
MISADMTTATSFPASGVGRSSVGIRLPLWPFGFVFVFSRVALLDLCDLLGYTRAVVVPKRYTTSREKQVQADGKIADVVLGEFSLKGKRNNAAVEARGSSQRISIYEFIDRDRRRGLFLAPSRSRGAFLLVLSVSGADSFVRCLSFRPEPNNAVPSGLLERLSLSKNRPRKTNAKPEAAKPPA